MEKVDMAYSRHPSVKLAAEVYNHAERHNPKTLEDRFLAVLEGAMSQANLPVENVYTAQQVKQLLSQAKDSNLTAAFGPLAENKTAAKILSKLSSVDVKKVYLCLAKDVINNKG